LRRLSGREFSAYLTRVVNDSDDNDLMFAASAAEYCDWETFNVSCQADEVIAVGRARYGRMTLGRCVTTNYGSIGCGADVTPYLDGQCSGRRACALNVITLSQLPLQTDKPCPPDFKYYLEATYECLKGVYVICMI